MSEHSSNLVWIDLEMTGLDPHKDSILEIASLITDNQLTVIEEGPSLLIHQPESILQSMSSWARVHHEASGLTDQVRQQGVPIAQAEERMLAFLMQHCSKGQSLLCGNSVWQDRAFLARYMPKIIDFLHYRMVDVTAVKELVLRWYPNDPHVEFKKQDTHRAVDDIRESVAELRHYRKYFFV